MKKLLLMLTLIAASAPLVCAQSSQDLHPPSSLMARPSNISSAPSPDPAATAQDDPVAKALEQATNRLAVAEEKNRLLAEQLQAKDDRIAAKDELIGVLRDELTKRAANQTDLARVDTLGEQKFSLCQGQLDLANARIHQLEHPGLLRTLFDPRFLEGGVVGYGFAHATGH